MVNWRKLRRLVMPGKRKHRGKGAMRPSGKSPYARYSKIKYNYPSEYIHNHLVNGVLCRHGKPVMRRDREHLEAAE